jgi:hypothetical protein
MDEQVRAMLQTLAVNVAAQQIAIQALMRCLPQAAADLAVKALSTEEVGLAFPIPDEQLSELQRLLLVLARTSGTQG